MKVNFAHIIFVGVITGSLTTSSWAGRYTSCGDGCCPHEFCAYKKICYPVLRCSFPCPDGFCDNGLCMPTKACHVNTDCPDAFACTMNYNLGYSTCQYDLDIGKTTCFDRFGHSVMKKYT